MAGGRHTRSDGDHAVTGVQTCALPISCEWPEDIDMRRAEEAKHRAEERIRQRQSIWENKSSKIALARAMVRLRAGRKYH